VDRETVTTPIAFISGKVSAKGVINTNQDKVLICISKMPDAAQMDIVTAATIQGRDLVDDHTREFSLAVSPGEWYAWATFGQAKSDQQKVIAKHGEYAYVDFQFA
jgi:hypothetical protein